VSCRVSASLRISKKSEMADPHPLSLYEVYTIGHCHYDIIRWRTAKQPYSQSFCPDIFVRNLLLAFTAAAKPLVTLFIGSSFIGWRLRWVLP